MAAMSIDCAERIDALLPQTQCRRCGYDGCRPYAEAVAGAKAEINRCPPGGEATIAKLARLLGRPSIAPDPSCGPRTPHAVALIDEGACIGCTLCIAACPVDAIVGAAKLMHTVIDARCTGCELCVPACPVDCIAMQVSGRAWTRGDAARAREHFVARNARLHARSAAAPAIPPSADDARQARRAAIAAALQRARARRVRRIGPTS